MFDQLFEEVPEREREREGEDFQRDGSARRGLEERGERTEEKLSAFETRREESIDGIIANPMFASMRERKLNRRI